jgi:hypothetical protein
MGQTSFRSAEILGGHGGRGPDADVANTAANLGAGGRNRTDTPFGNGILSAARLPVPPRPRALGRNWGRGSVPYTRLPFESVRCRSSSAESPKEGPESPDWGQAADGKNQSGNPGSNDGSGTEKIGVLSRRGRFLIVWNERHCTSVVKCLPLIFDEQSTGRDLKHSLPKAFHIILGISCVPLVLQ